jgi:hypothetical protein
MNEQKPPKGLLGRLTVVGRIVALASLVSVGGTLYWFLMFLNENVRDKALPSGHYPLAFLLIPAVIVALVLFVVGSFVLELLGVQIWKKPPDSNP